MSWLNYHHLLYFSRVARAGSLTLASAELRLSPSTVSAQIAQLERALEQPLFTRRGRRLALTETGRVVLRYAEEIFSLGDELVAAVQGGARARVPRLLVGVSDSLPKSIVRRLLEPALRGATPHRVVCREDGTFEDFVADLAAHKLDLVLADRAAPPGSSGRVYGHLLGESGTTFLAAPVHAAARRGFPGSLAKVPCLLPGATSALRRAIDAWLARIGVHPRIVGEFDDSALMNDLGRDGLGVYPVPTILERALARSQGVRVVGHAPEVRQRFYALTAERRLAHPAVAAISASARADLFG